MRPSPGLTPVTAPQREKLVLQADNISVTDSRLLVDGYAFALADLSPVSVYPDLLHGYKIDLCSLSGQNLRTIRARDQEFLEKIATAINRGVSANRGDAADEEEAPSNTSAYK